MNQDEQLRNTTRYRSPAGGKKPAGLADVLSRYIRHQISPRRGQFASALEVWNDMVPERLRQHCKLAGISGDELKVIVDSPPYMYELRLLRGELKRQLAYRCRNRPVKKISFTIGTISGNDAALRL